MESIFYEIDIAYRLALIHSRPTCSSSLQSKL